MALYGGITLSGRPDPENIRKLDLLPMKSIGEMQRFGMAIDKEWFAELSFKLGNEMSDLRADIFSYIPPEKLDEFIARSGMDSENDYLPMNVDSNLQLGELLFNVLGIGAGKQLKMTKSGDQISTGKRQLEQLKRTHPILRHVLKYREYAKLKSTYTDKLPIIARLHERSSHGRCCAICEAEHEVETWRVHTKILTTRTSTGRFASKDPNLQNQPIRSKYGADSRRGFIATPGMEMFSVDFSQLQLRFLADLANELKMLWVFEHDKDLHTMTAMWAFGLDDESQVDKLTQRAPAKNVNFAVAFGETPKGLFDQLVSDSYGKSEIEVPDWLTLDWCEGFLDKWHGIYPAVMPYMEKQFYRARRYGVVWDMFGRVRRVPEVRSVHGRVIAAGLRQAGNHPVQAPDSGVMRLALAEVQATVIEPIRAQGIECRLLMTVHDELIGEVEHGYGELVKTQCEAVMESVLTDRDSGENMCKVKIKAEGHVMESGRWEK